MLSNKIAKTTHTSHDSGLKVEPVNKIATIYESKNQIIPQSYAGDATYSNSIDNNKHVPGNKISGYDYYY